MIDFAKITKTLDGYDCHYFGTRESYGTKLHCFGVWTPTGLYEKCYDDQGRHLQFSMDGEWEVSATNAFAIVKPPKIVEITRWAGLFVDDNEEYHVKTAICKENLQGSKGYLLASEEHTFRFEVPNE